MANLQTRRSNFFLSLLITYYILFDMPTTRWHVSTYISVVLLAVLFVGILASLKTIKKADGLYILVVALYLVLLAVKKIADGAHLAIGLWQILLEILPLLLGWMLIYNKYDRIVRMAIVLIFLTVIITSITTYAGLLKYPLASRELATGNPNSHGVQYTRLNIGGFEFIYSMVVVHPIFVYFLRRRKHTLYAVLITLLFALCVVASKYGMALMGFVVSLCAYIFPAQDKGRTKRYAGLNLAVVLGVGLLFAPRILIALSELDILSSQVSAKIQDVARLLQGEDVLLQNTKARQSLYALSFNTFLQHPLFGSELIGKPTYGAHSWILDIMARWGVVGLSIAVALLVEIAKLYRRLFADSRAYYYVQLSLYLAIVYAVVNPILFSYAIGFVVPILAYGANSLPERSDRQQLACGEG